MSDKSSIKILQADGSITRAEISIEQTTPGRLRFSSPEATDLVFDGSDAFEAFRALRKHLERKGSKALCAGARIDVFPSGMARSMSGGRKAYITQLGVPANETVDIFDDAAPELVGTVSEQTDYHKKWVLSLKDRRGRTDGA